MDAPSGSMVVYATAPGSVAADGSGRNGTFTKNLLIHLNTPGLEIGQMLRKVRVDVRKETGGKQTPWESSSLEGSFCFVGTGNDVVPRQDLVIPTLPGNTGSFDFGDIGKLAEVKAKWAEWQVNLDGAYKDALKYDKNTYLSDADKAQVWKRIVDSFNQDNPYSTDDELIRNKAMERINYWKSYREPEQTSVTSRPQTANDHEYKDPATGMEFVFVKGGCYQMGDTFGDGEDDEKPVHEVCVDEF